VNVLCDSQSAIHLATNPAYHENTKHIDVRYHFLRHVIDGEKIGLKKVHTRENYARIFAKRRDAAMVFSFSWLAEEMMNGHGQGIRKIVVKVEFVGI
jgi:hypothetical protein